MSQPERLADSPGRWFGSWNFRIFPPEEGGDIPEPRVLAWTLAGKRWEVVSREELRNGDVWLPLPGRPFERDSGSHELEIARHERRAEESRKVAAAHRVELLELEEARAVIDMVTMPECGGSPQQAELDRIAEIAAAQFPKI